MATVRCSMTTGCRRGRLHNCRSHLKYPTGMVRRRCQPEKQRLCQPARLRRLRPTQRQRQAAAARACFPKLPQVLFCCKCAYKEVSVHSNSYTRHSLADVLHSCMYEILGWRQLGGTYTCSSHRTSSRLFIQKVVNIFLCTGWSSLICTPAATHAEINHSGSSPNQYKWPVVGSWPILDSFHFFVGARQLPRLAWQAARCAVFTVQVLLNFPFLFLELQPGIAIFSTIDFQAPQN